MSSSRFVPSARPILALQLSKAMHAHNFKVQEKDNKQILDDRYVILEESNNDLKSDLPLIQIDNSQFTVLNINSEFLNARYSELKQQLEALQRPFSLPQILQSVIGFVRNEFSDRNAHLVARVDEFSQQSSTQFETYLNFPLVMLEQFIKKKLGVCRHHALYLFYLLHRLKSDGLIPEGRINFYSARVSEGSRAHAWISYHNSITDDLFFIDSLNETRAYNLRNPTDRDTLTAKWGPVAITECIQRYNRVVDYTSLPKEDKTTFRASLSEQDSTRRRMRLNYYYARNPAELKVLHTDLNADAKNLRDVVQINNATVRTDIQRIQNSENLLKRHYDEIRDPRNRQQFLLALLLKSPEQRRAVLQKQNARDLLHLQKSLTSTLPNRRALYNQFPNFLDLSLDVIQLQAAQVTVHKKLLNDILGIIQSGRLVVKTSETCSCFTFLYNPGKEITLSDQSRIRVPDTAYAIYNKILKIDLKTASLQVLDGLIAEIREAAKQAISKGNSYRDDTTTGGFYRALAKPDIEQMQQALNTFVPIRSVSAESKLALSH